MARMINPAYTDSPPLLAAAPEAIIDAVLGSEHRVLLVGQPGIGKSTQVEERRVSACVPLLNRVICQVSIVRS